MGLTEIGMALIDDLVEETFEEFADSCKTACAEATDEIRRKIIMDWFGEYNSTDVLGALNELRPYMTHVGGSGQYSADIYTTTFVDIGKYAPRPRAEAWRGRHPDKAGVASPEWVLGTLQMEKGIIGLPYWESKITDKKGNVRVLVGHHPIQRGTGLSNYILNNPLWNTFESRVNSKIK